MARLRGVSALGVWPTATWLHGKTFNDLGIPAAMCCAIP
jgi:hypothetical protein